MLVQDAYTSDQFLESEVIWGEITQSRGGHRHKMEVERPSFYSALCSKPQRTRLLGACLGSTGVVIPHPGNFRGRNGTDPSTHIPPARPALQWDSGTSPPVLLLTSPTPAGDWQAEEQASQRRFRLHPWKAAQGPKSVAISTFPHPRASSSASLLHLFTLCIFRNIYKWAFSLLHTVDTPYLSILLSGSQTTVDVRVDVRDTC